ncbi:hypothetical protein [Amycolatopsis alkalitolerans]|uniref:Uncharacterized protein n=1 Tax=Amycolatopsis alkalitolerans TaxID=2547244 RepID=A0A5C4MBB7_9PSEU|nr:hypothetical protein [Amycolatopsis alkalitolerans]TNC29200.1 hypothetical protein FG385_03725 [Amycolatopsis alkalitolerans]
MDTHGRKRTVAAPRLTAALGLLLAVGVLAQGLTAGAFLQGDGQWHPWHEALGDALVLPPLISLVVALALFRRQPDTPSVLATRIVLLALVVIAIGAGHAGKSMLVVHIPTAIAVVGIAVRQATGFARIAEPQSGQPARSGYPDPEERSPSETKRRG